MSLHEAKGKSNSPEHGNDDEAVFAAAEVILSPAGKPSKKLCTEFQKGKCLRGDKCWFSHALPAKKMPCKNFKAGHCVFGDKCLFEHVQDILTTSTSDEDEETDDLVVLKKKDCPPPRTPCKYFSGGCKYGDQCYFLHETPSAKQDSTFDDDKNEPVVHENTEFALMKKMVTAMDAMKKQEKEEKEKEQVLDLVIVMDCTGTMGKWIDMARDQINSIVDSVLHEFPQSTIRVGFVAYRDHDVEERVSSIPLTTDIERVKEFIGEQSAYGGDDIPEDIPGGLQAAMDMDWKGHYRCIVLVTDAPCHGRKYHDFAIDSLGHPADPDIEEQMKEIARRGTAFLMIDLDPRTTAKMVPLLRHAYEYTRPSLCPPFRVVTLDKGAEAGSAFSEVIVNTVLTNMHPPNISPPCH